MHRILALVVLLVGARCVAVAETYLILPFFNTTNNASLDWIGESLAEGVREALAGEGLIVLDRSDRQEAYKRLSMRPNAPLTKASIIVLGEALDAEQVVSGTFELLPAEAASKSRGSLRITAQILDLRKMARGPEYMEIGALEDLAKLQTHLAWQTLQFVIPKSSPSEEEFKNRKPVIRVDALENYIRGLLATTSEQKLRLLTQAVRLEPAYSQANFSLGKLYWGKQNYKLASEALAKVSRTDDHYFEASFYLGLCRYRMNDFAGAQQAFQLVADVFPLNEVLNNLGAAQSRRSVATASDNFQKALDGDSADPDYQFNVGYALYKQGNLQAAAERFRAVLDRTPEDVEAMTMLGRCLKPTRAADPKAEGLERLKEAYEETAYRQLKAMLEPKR